MSCVMFCEIYQTLLASAITRRLDVKPIRHRQEISLWVSQDINDNKDNEDNACTKPTRPRRRV